MKVHFIGGKVKFTALVLTMPELFYLRVSAAGGRHHAAQAHYKEAIGVARDALARLPAAGAEAAATRELIAQTEAKYATHLLERAGEPEAAMQHYMQTIG